MSDTDSDAAPVKKVSKPKKSKYVLESEVSQKKPKEVKSSSKKRRKEESEEEDDEPAPAMSGADEENDDPQDQPKSLLDDDEDDAMVAAMEKSIKKNSKPKREEEKPAKKQRVDVKVVRSKGDDSNEGASAAAPSYDAFAAKKKPVKKEDASDASDDDEQTRMADEEQRSDKSDDDDESDADETAPAASSSAASSSKKFPFDANAMDPNFTARKWSESNLLHIHHSELNPLDNFSVLPAKNAGYAKSFFSIKCNKPQRIDFHAGSDFRPYKFGNETVVVGPFACTSHPRMWPYGDRLKMPHSQFPPPKYNSSIKFKLPLYNTGYANNLTQEKKGVGLVDPSADFFMQNWCRLGFDKWAKEQSWKWSTQMFPMRRKELFAKIEEHHKALDAAYENSKEEWRTYEEELADWSRVKKNKDPKPTPPRDPKLRKPDTSDARKDKELRDVFMREGVKASALTGTKDKFEHVNLAGPLLRNLTKKEREGDPEKGISPLNPNLPNDPFFVEAFQKPPMWKDEKSGEMKPGYPLIPVDVPMWRCVTAEEVLHNIETGYYKKNKSPHRLIPLEHRFIVSGDVVAPIFQIDSFDSKPGSGFRFKLLGVIWLGESGKLKDDQKPLPGVDPATYYCMAQPYTRRKGKFDPETVENSRYESARTNDAQGVQMEPEADDFYGGYD